LAIHCTLFFKVARKTNAVREKNANSPMRQPTDSHMLRSKFSTLIGSGTYGVFEVVNSLIATAIKLYLKGEMY